MPQYLKYLAAVPYGLLLITAPVSDCRLFSDINISQSSVATRLICVVFLAITLLQIYSRI